MIRSILALTGALSLGLIFAVARGEDRPAAAATDYADPAVWLCRPGRQDACSASQDATIVAVNGSLKRETFHAAKSPSIDCFYVYPTVSNEPGGNSDLTVTNAERMVVNTQFARFAAKCRVFAPMYRQVTLTALRAMLAGKPIPLDRDLGYSDVLAAWNYYLAHDNRGRGVVLVGHSQGSGVLTRLIKEEIDGKPIQGKLISAILMGTNLPVPKGADVGGAFKHIPVCRSNRQTVRDCVRGLSRRCATAGEFPLRQGARRHASGVRQSRRAGRRFRNARCVFVGGAHLDRFRRPARAVRLDPSGKADRYRLRQGSRAPQR
jgi:hypothetical protein